MVILLAGSTRIGRAAIANRMVKEMGEWRHLPVEELSELQPLEQVDIRERSDVMLRIACKCAEELQDQGYHIIISCDFSPTALTVAKDELGDRIIGVHMGSQPEIERSDFMHRLDAKTVTVGEVHDLLLSFC